jgi:hypothetical protein
MAVRRRRAGRVVATAGLLVVAVIGCGSGRAFFWGGVLGPAIVSADGRVLTVAGYASGCGITSTLVATQSMAHVALRVRDVAVRSCMPGEGALAVPPPLQVRLATPLGMRKLINGANGQPVRRFNARLLLRPRILPPGYRLRQVFPQLTGPAGHTIVRVQLWYYSRSERADGLVITESPDSPLVPRPWLSPARHSQWIRLRVRGVSGWAGPSVIAWRQGGLIYSISAGPPLITAQLIAIANSATG